MHVNEEHQTRENPSQVVNELDQCVLFFAWLCFLDPRKGHLDQIGGSFGFGRKNFNVHASHEIKAGNKQPGPDFLNQSFKGKKGRRVHLSSFGRTQGSGSRRSRTQLVGQGFPSSMLSEKSLWDLHCRRWRLES